MGKVNLECSQEIKQADMWTRNSKETFIMVQYPCSLKSLNEFAEAVHQWKSYVDHTLPTDAKSGKTNTLA
jgi:hypothetical protein